MSRPTTHPRSRGCFLKIQTQLLSPERAKLRVCARMPSGMIRGRVKEEETALGHWQFLWGLLRGSDWEDWIQWVRCREVIFWNTHDLLDSKWPSLYRRCVELLLQINIYCVIWRFLHGPGARTTSAEVESTLREMDFRRVDQRIRLEDIVWEKPLCLVSPNSPGYSTFST